MRNIIYTGLRYHYGDKSKGDSYEHRHIEAGICSLKDTNVIPIYIDVFDKLEIENKIISHIDNGECDLIFHVAFNDQLDIPDTACEYALSKGIPVVEWDCDASWRFQNFILPRKNKFSHFITTHNSTIPWYKQNGMRVVKSQWGTSPKYWASFNSEKKYDVSFLGQKHGIRSQLIRFLNDKNIKVDLFGEFWENHDGWHGVDNFMATMHSFDVMMSVHHSSKIGLNLSNPWHTGTMPQIKGRTFDLPAAGVFQICTYADDLFNYFEPSKEIVVATDPLDMAEKIKFFLKNDTARDKIARAAHDRAVSEHSYEKRFEHIFSEIGI